MNFSSDSLKNEKKVLESSYKSILPILVIVLGALATIAGLVLLVEEDDFSALLVGIVLIVVGAILNARADIHLVVTDKRVYCDGPFNNYVSLPLDHISSVGVHGGALNIASASGRIVISGAPDRYTVCNTITALLNGDGAPTAAPASASRYQAAPVQEMRPCESCGTMMRADEKYCTNCGHVVSGGAHRTAQANDGWKCSSCGRTNPNYQTTCSCGAKKPHAAPVTAQ